MGLVCHFTTLKLSIILYNTSSGTALFTVFDFYRKIPESMTARNWKGKLNLENNLWFLAIAGERPASE